MLLWPVFYTSILWFWHTHTHANTQTVSPLALFWFSLFHLSIVADILLLSYTPLVMVFESAGPDDPQGCVCVISKEFMPARWAPTSYNSTYRCDMTPVTHLFFRPFKGAQKSRKLHLKADHYKGPPCGNFKSPTVRSQHVVRCSFQHGSSGFWSGSLSVNHR